MLAIDVQPRLDPRLVAVLNDVGPAWRRQLFSVGAAALANLLRRHLLREARSRHATANRLHAPYTQHIYKGASRISTRSTASKAVVTVPIAGISRAFQPLVITPAKARDLTIPIAAAAYGHSVRELRRLGWQVFRVKHRDFLMGRPKSDKKAIPLYALKKRVTIPQDRSLLPSDDEIASSVNAAVITAVRAVAAAK